MDGTAPTAPLCHDEAQQHEALLTLTQNPADRLWRYPICRAVVGPFVRSPLRANHVTLAHTALGVSAGWLVSHGDTRSLMAAGALFEVRAILDCFDGVLARAQQRSSRYGRAMDQLGDSLAFVALMLGYGVALSRIYGVSVGASLALVTTWLAATSTSCWDVYRRRFSSLLVHGHDEVEREYLQLSDDYHARGGFALWYSWFVATYQAMIFHPGAVARARARAAGRATASDGALTDHDDHDASAARLREMARANDPTLRMAILRVGYTGADSVLVILTATLLLGQLWQGLVLGALYAVATLALTPHACNRVLQTQTAALAVH